jgi:hypothetical protein
MIIEIGFTYQYDKHSPVETSWTYFYVKGDDFEKAKTKAKTYWKKFITDLGWIKKAKLTHIEEIQNGKNYTPNHIIVDSGELPPARKRESSLPPKKTLSSRKSPSPSRTKTRRSVRNKA